MYLCFFMCQTVKYLCISKQIIQKISAIDKDDPPNGHQFYFSLTAEAANNHNFTLQDNKGKNIKATEPFCLSKYSCLTPSDLNILC